MVRSRFFSSLGLILAVGLVASLRAQEQPKPGDHPTVYTSKKCGFRIHIPAGWVLIPFAEADEVQNGCGFRLQRRDRAQQIKLDHDQDLYSITVATVDQDLAAAAETGLFAKEEGKWVVKGRMDMSSPAEEISSDKWVGLRGVATVGCERVHGGAPPELCEIPRAVLNNRGSRSAIFYGAPRSGEVFAQVLKEFEFL